jgi:hypothetical protein
MTLASTPRRGRLRKSVRVRRRCSGWKAVTAAGDRPAGEWDKATCPPSLVRGSLFPFVFGFCSTVVHSRLSHNTTQRSAHCAVERPQRSFNVSPAAVQLQGLIFRGETAPRERSWSSAAQHCSCSMQRTFGYSCTVGEPPPQSELRWSHPHTVAHATRTAMQPGTTPHAYMYLF